MNSLYTNAEITVLTVACGPGGRLDRDPAALAAASTATMQPWPPPRPRPCSHGSSVSSFVISSTCYSFYTNVLCRSSSCLRLLPGLHLLPGLRLRPRPPQAGEDEVIVDYHGLEEAWPASPLRGLYKNCHSCLALFCLDLRPGPPPPAWPAACLPSTCIKTVTPAWPAFYQALPGPPPPAWPAARLASTLV